MFLGPQLAIYGDGQCMLTAALTLWEGFINRCTFLTIFIPLLTITPDIKRCLHQHGV